MTDLPSTERIAAILAIAATLSALIALLIPVSQSKGRVRLIGSCLIGAAFLLASLTEMIHRKQLWPEGILTAGGIFLVWVGIRKYRRDPEGRTPAAKIL
jgi:threonine/homoserine/homoserine lactone efflux protein